MFLAVIIPPEIKSIYSIRSLRGNVCFTLNQFFEFEGVLYKCYFCKMKSQSVLKRDRSGFTALKCAAIQQSLER